MSTTQPRITKTPGVCGGRACVAGHRIPVWILDAYRREGMTGAQVLESYPSITLEDVRAAWDYAAQHPEEIEADRRENEEEPDEWEARLRRWATDRRPLPLDIDDSRESIYEGCGE